ncbi:DUF1214 domain-containing protein [Methylobrevis pamukkalensis]|uniref:DUF1214 domain-containing protein n=1 Tax=Methylobrevis pamukkalensis TaxID=1439726 RepID=A0A1E3H7W1_9HYPH|nr:DUF1214 domain-containing protein [Methylobrevis pamukkalensis]ODN72417.1 hypothetical protein A6302_00163 [Methylobrevis pamukkalensis]
MPLIRNVLLIAVVSAVLGLGSVRHALDLTVFDDVRDYGPWRAVLPATAATANPYLAARLARSGEVPLGPVLGLALTARSDDDGAPLDPACHYVISGDLAFADLWTLTVSAGDGRLAPPPAPRFAFTSRDVLRSPQGFDITVGPTARPGNFLSDAGLDDIVLTLRIYDPALVAALYETPPPFPRIRLQGCA